MVDVAASDQDFSTLVTAVQTAGLAETLSGAGPFTVFAPVNDAFAALPQGTVDSLLQPANRDQLTSVLTYHVVSGKVSSSQVVKMTSAKTLQGGSVKISAKDGGVMIDGAQVVKADVEAVNGVIHVIDAVILPQ